MDEQAVAEAQEYVRGAITDPPADMPPISGGVTPKGERWVCLNLGGATPVIVLSEPPELHATPVSLQLTVEWTNGGETDDDEQ